MRRGRARQAALAAAALGGGSLAARSARLLWRRRDLNWSAPERFSQDAFLHVQRMGNGHSPVLLLHSLEGSSGYFGSAFDELADPGPLLVPDLLGFGRSPKSESGYSADEHVAALLQMLERLDVADPLLVVGHGLGGVVGLRLAVLHPERVGALVMISPAVYSDPDSARRWLGVRASGRRLDRALAGGFRGRPAALRKTSRMLGAPLRPDLPAPVAQDRLVALGGDASSSSLEDCVINAPTADWLRQVGCPVDLLVPSQDRSLDLTLLREIAASNQRISLTQLPFGDGRLPLTHPDGCLAAIDRFRERAAGAVPTSPAPPAQEVNLL
jgi:pimeloyl-ACP methyl ester carboxylesterase